MPDKQNETKFPCLLSGSSLKALALVCMTFDHIGAYIPGVCDPLLFRAVGRVAFPIFAFLLAEGFAHTRDVSRYALRLLLLAVLSEVPFDLMTHGTPFHWQSQNVMWTLLLGLVCLFLWDAIRCNRFLRIISCLLVIASAFLLKTDYGCWGVFLPVLFHILGNNRDARLLAGAASSTNIYQCAAYVFIAQYNGQRGFIHGKWKWVFYFYYPVHMLLIFLISLILT